jgi:hypothetical protein
MSLDSKRKKLELMQVKTARMALEFKIDERLEEIERLKEHVKIQIEKENQLAKELENK